MIMYEENLTPLPDSDGSVVFAEILKQMHHNGLDTPAPPVTPESVLRWADRARLPPVATICRRLLLPGSGLEGLDSLRQLIKLADSGRSCLLCLNHRSTLDVPTLFTLLEDQADPELFQRLIWISGRKLEEDAGMTSVLVQCVNRVVVSPNTWFTTERSEEELRQGRLVNVAAERSVARLRHEGWVFGLFPAGTRTRLNDPSTRQAIEQVHGYLEMFDHLLLGHIDGCTMPVSRDHDLTRESPRLDRVRFTFGPVHQTQQWCREACLRFPDDDPHAAMASAITQDLEHLAGGKAAEAKDSNQRATDRSENRHAPEDDAPLTA